MTWRGISCIEVAARLSAVPLDDVSQIVPFTIIVKSPFVEQPPSEDSLRTGKLSEDHLQSPSIPKEAFAELPIWQLPPQPLAFTCQRATAKQLAQAFLDAILPLAQADQVH